MMQIGGNSTLHFLLPGMAIGVPGRSVELTPELIYIRTTGTVNVETNSTLSSILALSEKATLKLFDFILCNTMVMSPTKRRLVPGK